MAERRMFAKTIIDSDAFLDMPSTTQVLYFHLSMRADDEGFVNSPKKVQRMVNCSDDDMKLLIAKSFIIPFESGVIVIKHWKLHNKIRKDRFVETVHQDEKSKLYTKSNGAYTLDKNKSCNQLTTKPQPTDNQTATTGTLRIGKDRLGEDRLDKISESAKEEIFFISLLLESGEEYPITKSKVNELIELYPAVDVEQELRSMKGWLIANPKNRKKKTGILRFVNGWLKRSIGDVKKEEQQQVPNGVKYVTDNLTKGRMEELW